MSRPPTCPPIQWPEGNTRTDMERFHDVLRHILSVPKAEIDRRLGSEREQRALFRADRAARARGHDLEPFVRDGDGWVSECIKPGCRRPARFVDGKRDGMAFVGRCRAGEQKANP